MAKTLVELGATHLVELGRATLGERLESLGKVRRSRGAPVARMFQWVDRLEDPLGGYPEPKKGWKPQQVAIADQMRTIAKSARPRRVRRMRLHGVEGIGSFVRSRRYLSALTSADLSIDDFATKVGDAGDSPVTLDLVGAMANDIPETRVDVADAINQAAADPDTYPNAVSATAMNLATGGSLETMIHPQVVFDAQPLVPQIQEDMQTVGPDAFSSALTKGVGQLVALDQLAQGSGKADGVAGPSVSSALAKAVQVPAVAQAAALGAEDLKNSAATTGSTATVSHAIAAGQPSFPVVPVAIGVGAVGLLALGLWLFS